MLFSVIFQLKRRPSPRRSRVRVHSVCCGCVIEATVRLVFCHFDTRYAVAHHFSCEKLVNYSYRPDPKVCISLNDEIGRFTYTMKALFPFGTTRAPRCGKASRCAAPAPS